ncbi:MAG: hypothetical protein IK105_05520 [Thermoguttaceae bacterium]|nr:hypothetical protein [Thermoguttaceae bacterium]
MFTLTLLLVIGTFLAVFVSLFGEQLKRVWFGPRLEVVLRNTHGEISTFNNGGIGIFYHLIIRNKKGDMAHNVLAYLTKYEAKNTRNELFLTWEGEAPLQWRYSFLHGYRTFNIGTDQTSDLFCVTADGLRLEAICPPNSLTSTHSKHGGGGCDIVLTVCAKGEEAISPEKKFHIKWDGVWIPEPEEMKFHLTVEEMSENEYQEWNTFAKNEVLGA